MNPPPDVAVKEDLNLLLWRPQGLLTQKIVNGILAFIREAEAHRLEKTELRFTDTTKITEVELNFEFVFFVAMYRRTTHPRGAAIRSAFFAPNEAFAHYFRLHAALNQRSSLQARVFCERETAARWLKLPLSALEFPTVGAK